VTVPVALRFEQVVAGYRGAPVLDRFDLAVDGGQRVALLGPSGSGKTTLLRVVAGLEQPDPGSGPILFHDEDVALTHARDRQVGFVFQHYALFRHMTVFENVAFGLRQRKTPQAEIERRVAESLELVHLTGLERRLPRELSGGQQQRVAVARAVITNPKLILADEPTGNLDSTNGEEVLELLNQLNADGTTIIMVTHDPHAAERSHRTVHLDKGMLREDPP